MGVRISFRRQTMTAIVGLTAVAAGGYWAVSRALLAFQVAQVERWATAEEPAHRLPDIERVAQKHSDSAALAYWLAVAYRRTGKLDRVEAPLQRAAEIGWPHDDIVRQRKLTLFLVGDFHESEPYLRELIVSGVSDDVGEEIYEALVKGYLSAVRVGDAKACLEYWLKWRPNTPRARLWLAEISRVLRDDKAEEAQYRAIVAADPENFEWHLHLATFLLKATRVDEALKEYARSSELRPDRPGPLIGLAECQERLGQVSEARQTLERALRLPLEESSRGHALKTLGQILLAEREKNASIKVLREATEILPNDHSAWYALGQALSSTGDKEEATRCLERSKELAFSASVLQNAYLEVIDDPQNADLRCELAVLFEQQGQIQTAMDFYRSVLEIDQEHTAAHAALADYYASAGREDLAAPHREQAAKGRPAKDDARRGTDRHTGAAGRNGMGPQAIAADAPHAPEM